MSRRIQNGTIQLITRLQAREHFGQRRDLISTRGTLPALPGIQNIQQANFFVKLQPHRKNSDFFNCDDYFSSCCRLTNVGTHFKKVLKNLKSGPKAPKICILLSLLIFDRVNEIKICFFEVTPHEYAIPKWYSMQPSVSYGLRDAVTC